MKKIVALQGESEGCISPFSRLNFTKFSSCFASAGLNWYSGGGLGMVLLSSILYFITLLGGN